MFLKDALSLTTASPSLGTPRFGQRHRLEANGIELPPFAEPPAEGSLHRLNAIGIGTNRPKSGRPKAFSQALANELRTLLEVELRRRPQFPKLPAQKTSIGIVQSHIKLKGAQLPSAITIKREIVRPVHRRLRSNFGRKQGKKN